MMSGGGGGGIAEEQRECAQLDLALQRISLLEDSKLEKTLSKLLPMVIAQLSSTHAKTKTKTVELLTHVNKRTNGLRDIEFPLEGLIEVVLGKSGRENSLVRTFGMMYAKKAFERSKASHETKRRSAERLLEALFSTDGGIEDEKTVQEVLRVAVDIIGEENVKERWSIGNSAKWMSNARTRKRFLRHVLATVQYQWNLAKTTSGSGVDVELASAEMRRAREQSFVSGVARLAGNAIPSGGAAAPADEEDENKPGPGLSESLMKEILGDVAVSDKEARMKARESASSSSAGRWRMGVDLKSLAERKKALLEFLAEACVYEEDEKENETTVGGEEEDENAMQVELPRTVKKYIVSAEELFPIALAVACDASEACRSYGETVLKKRCGVDGARPDLDADNEAFITHQLRWFLGDSEDIPREIRVQPASDEIRSNILRRVLSRSQRSANLFPQNVEIVSSSLNNPRSKQLRASGIEFSAWVLRNAEKDILEKAALKLLETCMITLDTLETSSPATMTTSERIRAMELKGFCFQSLGHLIERAPELIKASQDMMMAESASSKSSIDSVDVARALLRACEEDSIVKEGEKLAMEYVVAEVLERYASTTFASSDASYSDATGEGKATPPGAKSALLLALRFAGSENCFRFDSVAVRFACALNCARPELDIRDAARSALILRKEGKMDGYSTVARMLDRAESKNTLLAKDPQREDDQSPLPEKVMFALLKFLRQSRRFHMNRGADDACTSASYRRFLKHCLLRTSGPRLASLALIELRDVLFSAHKAEGSSSMANERDNYQYYLRAAKFFSATDDAITRKASANLIGAMLKLNSFTESDVEALVSGFLETASKAVALNENDAAAAAKLRAELADGALRSLSALIATTTKETASMFTPERYELAKSIFRKAVLNVPRTDAPSKEVMLGISGCECLGTLFTSNNNFVISHDDIAALSQAMDRAAAAPKVAASAAFAAGCALRRGATIATSLDAAKPLVEKVFSLLTVKKDDVRFAVADSIKFGFYGESDLVLSTDIASEDGGDASLTPFVRDIDREVDELFESPKEPTSDSMDIGTEATTPSVKIGDGEESTDATVGNRNALREIILKYLFDDDGKEGESKVGFLFSSREEIRCGATAVLCSIVNPSISSASIVSDDAVDANDEDSNAKKGTKINTIPLLESRFDDAHEALLSALGDTNTTTQEMASTGLSALYDRGDEASKATLLENLTKALNGETSNKGKKRAMSKVEDDTVVFQDGLNLTGDDALKAKAKEKTKSTSDNGGGGGNGGDSMLSTYKELCSVVSDIGQPDLLYKFMEISNHQKKVNRAASAGAGIARIAKKAGMSLSAHSEQLAPRLYRLRKDVNLNMRETAEAAWQTLVAAEKEKKSDDDNKMVVASDLSVKMFDQICERLLLDCSSREWRVRQSAAEALAELFSSGGAGKTFDIVEKKLGEAWTIAFRVADDIKETVRIRGMMFVKTLRSLSLRLTDANQIGESLASSTRDEKRNVAKKACILILPQLFEKGLKSDSSVARELSLFVACEILKKAPAEALKPHCVTAVEALLEALSTFEDTRLNYYEQRVTAMFGNDTDANGNNSVVEDFQNARVQASSNSIISDALDAFIQHVDLEETKLLAPVFTNIFKKGLGLNTKVGAGRFCVRLCARRPDAAKGFFAGKICEALLASPDVLNGVSSGGASSKIVFRQYCQTFATCLRFATLKRQEKTIADVLKLANDDSSNCSNREAAAEIISEMAKDSRGVECLKDFEDELLPLAYFGTFDENASVAKCWESAWEELSGGGAGAVGGGSAIGKHFPILWNSFLKPHLEGTNYSLKSRAARTVSAAMQSTSFSTKDASINNTDEMNANKEKMIRDMLEVFSNELRSNRAFKGKNDLAIALGDVLKAMISMAMVEKNGSNKDASFEALNRLTKCVESKDDGFAAAGVQALKSSLEQLVASGPGEEENVAPGSFVKDEKFQSFVEALVSNLTARVSSGVDGRDAGMRDTNNEETDEMEMDGLDAEVERFEKNKSKTAFTERAMECLSVVGELKDVASSDVHSALYRVAIEHSALGKPWQTRVSSFRMFRGLFTSSKSSSNVGGEKYNDEFLRISSEALSEVGNSAPAALRIETIKAVGALLSRAKMESSLSKLKESCESMIKLALEDRSPDVRREAASVFALV
ncbi:unnamed protein product [Bathycoccus prasinos]